MGLWKPHLRAQNIAANVSGVYDVESANTKLNYEEHKFLILTKKRGLLKHPTTMDSQKYYDQARKAGLTEAITCNPDPNYNESFYQSIFRLMESFAQSKIDNSIQLNGAEIQSNHSRVAWAEGLILQLPITHEGRNSWLINYGHSDEASEHRANWSDVNGGRNLVYDKKTDSYLLPRAVGV